MILTKTSTNTDQSSSSQERLISLSPNDAILFRDVLLVLQYDWIAVYAATGTIHYRPDPLRVWLRETTWPRGRSAG